LFVIRECYRIYLDYATLCPWHFYQAFSKLRVVLIDNTRSPAHPKPHALGINPISFFRTQKSHNRADIRWQTDPAQSGMAGNMGIDILVNNFHFNFDETLLQILLQNRRSS